MINKALLPTELCAIDFIAHLESWGAPARQIKRPDGSGTRYVIFDGKTLSTSQIANLDGIHAPIYCNIYIHDVKLIEELT